MSKIKMAIGFALIISAWYLIVFALMDRGDDRIPAECGVVYSNVALLAVDALNNRPISDPPNVNNKYIGRVEYKYSVSNKPNGVVITAVPNVKTSYMYSLFDRIVFLRSAKFSWFEYRIDTSGSPVVVMARKGPGSEFSRFSNDEISKDWPK